MNKKDKIIIYVAIALILAFLIGIFVWGRKSNDEAPPPSHIEVDETPETSPDALPEAHHSGNFKEIVFTDEPTEYGKTDYQTIADAISSDLKTPKNTTLITMMGMGDDILKIASGHTVYKCPDDGKKYIVSGELLLEYDNAILPDNKGFLREEGTGKKIYRCYNDSDKNWFYEARDAGRRLLSGETIGEKGTIVVDGVYTDFKYTTNEDGEIVFKLSEVGPQISPSTYYSEDMGYINISPNEFISIQVPTTAASEGLKKTHNMYGNTFQFNSWVGGDFSFRAPVLNNQTTEITARDASRMFGWRFFTDGTTLSIISDPLNIADKAYVDMAGSADGDGATGIRSVVEFNEDGSCVLNTYDSHGRLIRSKPLDVSDVDDIEIDESSESVPDETATEDVNENLGL